MRLMFRTLSFVFLGAAALAGVTGCASVPVAANAPRPFLSYSVTLKDLDLRLLHVTGSVCGARARAVLLRGIAPPGESAFDPIGLGAIDARGRALRVRQAGGGWIVENRGRDFSFAYDVVLRVKDRASPDVRSMITVFDDDRARLLARDVLLVPAIDAADGIMLDIRLAPGWGGGAAAPPRGPRVIVRDLDELPETMAVCGAYRRLSADVDGAELVLAVAGSWRFSDEQFFEVVRRVVAEEIALFGSPLRPRYLFVLDGNPVRRGDRFDYYGLHQGGNMLLLLDRRLDRSELVDTPMAIVAHEFFHNWNGDALHAASDSFQWFVEGVTVYYSYRVLVDAGIITEAQYARRLSSIEERYLSNPLLESVAIGSSGNADMRDKDMVSLLYDGGFLAARAIDDRIAAETHGRARLIDVLKRMYADADGHGAMDEASFLSAARELGEGDLAPFLRELVHTPAPRILSRASL
jgi:predicted metalloprotease with PDZ domain